MGGGAIGNPLHISPMDFTTLFKCGVRKSNRNCLIVKRQRNYKNDLMHKQDTEKAQN